MNYDNQNILDCVQKIGTLVDGRHKEEFHIGADVARCMIYDYIKECIEKENNKSKRSFLNPLSW